MALHLKWLLAVLLIVATGVHGQGRKPSKVDDEKELRRLEVVWNKAHIDGDAAALERLWADDFILTVPHMSVMTKSDAIGVWRTGRVKFTRYETSDIRVRIYDNAAVVTGRLQRTRNPGSQAVEDDWHFTKVYIRMNSRWRVVAWQSSAST
jgi:hypothetical protein